MEKDMSCLDVRPVFLYFGWMLYYIVHQTLVNSGHWTMLFLYQNLASKIQNNSIKLYQDKFQKYSNTEAKNAKTQ